MDVVATLTNAFIVAAVDALLFGHSRGRFAKLEDEMKELRADGNRRFEVTMTELAAVRSDLTHVALAVGARARPEANPA